MFSDSMTAASITHGFYYSLTVIDPDLGLISS